MTAPCLQTDVALAQSAVEPLSQAKPSISVSLESILITEELYRRPHRAPDFQSENRALVTLARVLGDSPRTVLQTLAETVLDVLKVGSAGISRLAKDETCFDWPAIAGLWHIHAGGDVPRGFSPCGDVLDCNAPLLFKQIDLRYLYLQPVTPRAEECLSVPFYVGSKAVGTLWAIAHDEHRRFDAEDLRQLQSLSRFASAAHQTVAALDAAEEQAKFARSLVEDAVRFAVEVESLNADLRKSEKRFRTVFDSIDEGFCILEKVQDEADKALDFRYLEVNPAFAVLFTKGEVVGQTIRQAFPEETEEWLLTCEAVLSSGEPTRFERWLTQGRLLEVHAFKVEGVTQARVAVVFKDITQRKLAEDALRESEAFSRSIIASSPDCIKVLDLDGNLLSMRSGQELLGIEDIRPFLNKSWIEFWGGEDRIQALAALHAATAGHTGTFVGFYRTQRGEPKWWDVAISPIFDEQHKTVRLLAVSRDATKRKQIEDSLLQRTFQFEALVNNAPLGIYLVDADFRIRQVNPVALLEFGAIPELIGRDFGLAMRTLLDSTQADEIVSRFRHTLATGEAYEAPEYIDQRIDRKTTGYYEWQLNRIPLPDGSDGVVCYFRDISERVRAQERIRESEWRLSHAAQSAKLTYVEIDLESGAAQTPENFSAVMGYTAPQAQEVDGSAGVRALLEHVVPDDRSAVGTALQDFFAGKPVGKIEYRVRGDDHALRWIETQWSVVLGIDGKPLKSFATNIDISDRKQAEQAMRSSEERYRSLFNFMDEGYCIIEVIFDAEDKPVDWCFLEVNPAFTVLTGVVDAVGKRMRELAPDHEAHWFETYGRVALTGEAVRFVSEAKALDNRWFDLYAFKIGGPGCRTVAVLFNNITARKQAERALRDSEERYRTLFSSIDEGFSIVEMIFDEHNKPIDLCFLEVNPTFEKHTGLPNANGKRLLELIPAIESHWIDIYGKVALTGEAVRFVIQAKAIEGRWFDVYACKLGGPESRQVAIVFNDISESRKSEAALRQSEERFRALFERGPIAMYSCDRHGVIQEFNHRAVELWGREPNLGDAESAFRSSFKIFLPDGTLVPYSQTVMAKVLSGELPWAYDMEMAFERADGSRVSVIVNTVPLKGVEGGITGAINCFHDITQRRRAEEALRASEEQFRATFENAAIGIVHVGLDKRWLRVNPAMCQLTGYTTQELTAMTFTELTHPEDLANDLDNLQRLLTDDIRQYTIEKRLIHKNGREIWVNATASLLRNAAAQPQYFIGAIEDISEKKRTQAELDVQRRFVERLAHGMPNTLHVYSRAERRNLWVNRHLGDTLGYSAQDIEQMGQRFLQKVLHPDDVAAMELHFNRVFASADNDVLDIEYRVRDHAGHWRWLRQSDTVFRRDLLGQVAEVVGTATDVTGRKGTEAELNAALVAAEQANQAKSDFLSRMSHELRSPLNAVLGFGQLLQTGTPPPTALQQESVNEILKAGWYLLGLIDEILDLALIESGRLAFSLESVPLAEVLDDCHAMVEGQAVQSGISLNFVSVDDTFRVLADRTRVKQIFINLLSNAIKYNRPGGTVDVHFAMVAQGRVRISVQDSGSGLSAPQMAKLFQPFERAGQEAGVIEGTGIGLALSKELVELMGGRIGVHSTPGQGSVFWVELDAVGARSAMPEQAQLAEQPQLPHPPSVQEGPVAASAGRQFTVLCVEDNAANLMLVKQLLARHSGVHLLLACDGNLGLQMARALRPDVILMDIHLPGISGLEAMNQLSANVATAHIPVIAMSAHAMHHDIEKGLQAGFFRYLTKPIRIDTFMEALDGAMTLALTKAGPPLSIPFQKAHTP